MGENTCGKCDEFMKDSGRCGNPMVYINHGDNIHKTTAETPACWFFYPIKKEALNGNGR